MKIKSLITGSILIFSTQLTYAYDNNNNKLKIRTQSITGIPVTGANSFCGKSIFKFPNPFPRDLQLVLVGEYNEQENALDAIPLNEQNCTPETILATTTDSALVASLGNDDADPRLKNRKLRDAPTFLGPDGIRRVIPRYSESDSMFPPNKVGATDDITLGQWIKAKGKLNITCYENKSSDITINLKNLIPDSLYTMWGMYSTTLPDHTTKTLIPIPLGGVPNSLTSNIDGKSTFKREITGCPLEVLSDGSELMMVILNYHADGSAYGGDPDTGSARDKFILEDGHEFTSTHPAGILNHDQLIFPVRLLEYQ